MSLVPRDWCKKHRREYHGYECGRCVMERGLPKVPDAEPATPPAPEHPTPDTRPYAESVVCPKCGAATGQPCILPRGTHLWFGRVHAARGRLAVRMAKKGVRP